MIGQLLLHYRVVEKIGEGGQGTVYKVIDTTLDRPAVIKVLPPDLTDSASNLLRFEREAKLASSLDHPNICTIFGLHKVGDVQFIAMQYVEGRSVREIVGGQPLDLRRALSIAIQVTDALAAAHGRGISIYRAATTGTKELSTDCKKGSSFSVRQSCATRTTRSLTQDSPIVMFC